MQINHTIMETVPESLRAFFQTHRKLAVAFSGGSDSAYLLYAAKQCGAQAGAYYIKSQFQASFEYADAVRMARQLGYSLRTLQMDILSDESVAENPQNRCYHCKKRIFTEIIAAAKADGYDIVIDGTNASDDASDRPGMRALEELGVLSPLRKCGITKADLRVYSQRAGLFTWNKSAYACLATRIPSGMPITNALLKKIERSENLLMGMGFSDFRVRLTKDSAAKIQLRKSQLQRFVDMREEICHAFRDDFPEVLLDLRLRGE